MIITGHKKEIEKLKALYKNDSIPHALIFSGPGEVGKRTVARWFIKLINCEKKGSEPCNECPSCREITDNTHYDFLQVTAEKKEIEVEQIRGVSKMISCRSMKANYKGVVIDNAHLMNKTAQNALLKTLEEPTESTVIILVAEYPDLLFSTVRSRCVEIKFSVVAENDIFDMIGDRELATLAVGKPGRAVSYRDDKKLRKRAEELKKSADKATSGSTAQCFSEIAATTKDEDSSTVDLFITFLLAGLREQLKKDIGDRKKTERHCERIKKIERVVFLKITSNTNIRLALEDALL